MRKLHLLLAEWRYEHQLADLRAFHLMQCWASKEHPLKAEEIFPMLAGLTGADDGDFDFDDDDAVFSQTTAALDAVT